MAGHRQHLTSITTTRHPHNLIRHVEKQINNSTCVYYLELFYNKASSWMGPSPRSMPGSSLVEPQSAQPRWAPQRASIPTRCQPSRPTAGLYLETSEQHQVGQSPTSKTALRSLNTAQALWASVAGRSCSYAMRNHKHPPQPQFLQCAAMSSPQTSHLAGPQVSLHPHSHLPPSKQQQN